MDVLVMQALPAADFRAVAPVFDHIAGSYRWEAVHPGVEVLEISARTGEGLDAWCAWLRRTMTPTPRAE
jgi:hypothetical protein